MNAPRYVDRERTTLQELLASATETVRAEVQWGIDQRSALRRAEEEIETAARETKTRFEAELSQLESEYRTNRAQLESKVQREEETLQREYLDRKHELKTRYEEDEHLITDEAQQAQWATEAVYDAGKNKPRSHFEDYEKQLKTRAEAIRNFENEARQHITNCRQQGILNDLELFPRQVQPEENPFERFQARAAFVEASLAELKSLGLPRLFRGYQFAAIFVLVGLAAFYPLGLFVEWNYSLLVPYEIGATLLLGAALTWILYLQARGALAEVFQPLAQAAVDAQAYLEVALWMAAERRAQEEREFKMKIDLEQAATDERKTSKLQALQDRFEKDIFKLEETHRKRFPVARQQAAAALQQGEEDFQRRQTQIKKRYDMEVQKNTARAQRQRASAQTTSEEQWKQLVQRWHAQTEHTRAEVQQLQAESAAWFPAWDAPDWNEFRPARQIPPVIRFGELRVEPAQIAEGVPEAPALREKSLGPFDLPAMLEFPQRSSLLLTCDHAGKAAAVQTLQTVMLRLMTALPPGKVRFTIFDPVGLGENFAAFMHLADYNESLVNNRIWTESQHIEQRLADLTEHMETVIQKYLRHQYESIDEYNLFAGEIAEPYRFLVVANLPANFTEASARRLNSILSSGPRCGVYTLISCDVREKLPAGIKLDDLRQAAVHLAWEDGRFVWRDPDFGSYPLQLDPPPGPETVIRLLQLVGEAAKDANRVEVPFEFVAPPREQWWTGDSRSGVSVPLGRAGATKRQHLELGRGTSQHVLIAGKTGSGKSTLLHALITNTALLYSPQQVELYLIDFKKGVEFKAYASHALPHARVIAVESEREFGLSVLQRLDVEMQRRGEMYRKLGVQDLRGFREAEPNEPLPRIMLIVDEFQEFFVEDDRVAQESSLLMDRLVRQGRAFGIHVLFGSQTLGGSYSLARSTLGQMAVRIALQCSENDAHLILSEENSAARLLSRPGEAIYNDANGLMEGNHPFQVVWLGDERKDRYLDDIQELAVKHEFQRSVPQIIFEGNAPADARNNPPLAHCLRQSGWDAEPKAAAAWLGEAIAIKDPTTAVLRPQSGSNVLMIGQHPDAALGILTTTILGLAAQHPPADTIEASTGCRFYVLDGSPIDSVLHGTLHKLRDYLPHPMERLHRKNLDEVLGALRAEVDRREKEGLTSLAALYVILYDLGRLRELRKQDDDFGFSRDSGPPSPSKQLAYLLREGPHVRVHTLAWCDTLANVNRAFDRPTLREFDQRVLFQMSAADSSSLIDSPAASHLGMNRALYYNEEQGDLEKFRPYSVPDFGWLEEIRAKFSSRTLARSR